MKNKVVIFDLDGVLFESCKLVCEYFTGIYPTMTKKIIDELLCGNFHEELEKFKLVNEPIKETSDEKEKRKVSYSLKKSKVPLYKGVYEMLKKLHSKGFVLTINTSAFEKNCLPLLEHAGISNLFDFVATAEISKSKIEKFKIIEKKYGISKKSMIFITDTIGDIHEASKVNIPTVAVTWGAHDVSYFKREPHDNLVKIVESVRELESVIENI